SCARCADEVGDLHWGGPVGIEMAPGRRLCEAKAARFAMTRLIQLTHPQRGRRVGAVSGDRIRLIEGVYSAYELAQSALAKGMSLEKTAADLTGKEALEYEPIHSGRSGWQILPAFDHPEEPARSLVAGAG